MWCGILFVFTRMRENQFLKVEERSDVKELQRLYQPSF